MTVIGRRSAVPGNDAGGRPGDLAGVSPVLRAGIALRRRLRGPAARRSFRGRLRPAPRRSRARGTRLRIVRGSIAFGHWATFIVVAAHGSILMTVPGRPRVQAGSAGRPLWAETRPVRTLPENGCYLRLAAARVDSPLGYITLSSVMGRSRTRLPVALNTALATAAPTPVMPISPTPRAPTGAWGSG